MKAINIPINYEHIEAAQSEADAKRELSKASMTELGRAKLEAIEKAAKELKAAGVEFYLLGLNDGTDLKNNYSFFIFPNAEEKEYVEDQRKFGFRVLTNMIASCETLVNNGISFILHNEKEDSPLYTSPRAVKILRARQKGLTPPPDSL